MKPTLVSVRALACAVLLTVVGAALPVTSNAGILHFGLARSAPADKSVVHTLTEVRLWFTEAPSEASLSFRLMGPDGTQVPTSDPIRDPDDGKAYRLRLNGPAVPGAYTVVWRGMASDGHVVRGEFAFTLMAH